MITAEQKAARLKRAKQHAAADRLRRGKYSDATDHSIGCSVGCDAIDIAGWQLQYDNPHAIVAAHDGTPEWLEHLRDVVFERLPAEKRVWWHVALAEALPVGVDLQPAYHQICIAILNQTLEHREAWKEPYGAQVVGALEQAIAYHLEPSESTAESVDSVARSVVESVVLSALRSVSSMAELVALLVDSAAAWIRIADDVIAILKQQAE